MPNLSKTLTVYEGADLTPARNRTDETVWEQTELGYYAQMGESAASTWAAHNDTGQTIFVRPHNYAKLVVGSNTIWTGRVAARNTERGETVTNPHRFHSTTMEDGNSHLRGIIVHNWERPQETDAARVQALVARYLSGNPRNSTNLNGSNYVVTGSNTITLPAQTYSGIEPFDVLQDIAEITDKTFFVSVDDELHYYGHDYTGYSSILRVSEDIADLNTVTCVPIDPSESEFSREIPTTMRTYWRNPDGGNERSWVDENNTTKSQLDYWQIAYWDSESENRTEAERASAQRFQAMDRGNFSHTLTIGAPGTLPQTVVNPQGQVGTAGQPMTGDDVWKVKPGQLIAYKSTVLRGADPAFFTRRIVGIRWTFPAADSYFATLELESLKPIGPRRRGGRDGGGGRRPTPAPECVEDAGTVTDIATWTFGVTGNSNNDEGDGYDSGVGYHGTTHTFSGGSMPGAHGDVGPGGSTSDQVPFSAGDTLYVAMDFRWKYDPTGRPIKVRFLDATSGGSVLETWTFEDGTGRATNVVHHLESTHVAPTSTQSVQIVWPTFNSTNLVDNIVIGVQGSPTECDEHAVDYGDHPSDSPYYLPSDYVEDRLDDLQDQITAAPNELSWKRPVVVATTTAGALTSDFEAGDTVDGVVLTAGDRILIKDQVSGADNGIYEVQPSGAPIRAEDFDESADVPGAAVIVMEGTANGDKLYACTTDEPITIDTTTLVFTEIGGGSGALTKTGGEKHTVSTVAASGTTETLDLADGNLHDVTLDADCTFTFTGATNGVGCYLTLILRQDGTGAREVTWPASVEWPDGTAPTLSSAANAVDIFSFLSRDGGTTWFGASAGSVTAASIQNIGHWETIVSGSAPPVAVTNEAADDWLVGWVDG